MKIPLPDVLMKMPPVRKRGQHFGILHIVVLLFFSISGIQSWCDFPSFLNKTGAWTVTYSNNGFLTMIFKRDIYSANYCRDQNSCVKYKRKCIQEVEPGRFLVEHTIENDGYGAANTKYMCMQFINRSDTVVQMKTSFKLSWRNPNLCSEDNLELDHYPILLANSIASSSSNMRCPITGGYNMKIRDSQGSICADKLILPRMESECEPGDGIMFNFRYNECVHKNLQMNTRQTVHCIASWEHGKYTFVMIKSGSSTFEAWCLRITNSKDESEKQMHLFMETVCDPGDKQGLGNGRITLTENYLSITLQRYSIQSVCANEFEGCTKDQFCSTSIADYCNWTCRGCETESDVCLFDEPVRGSWVLENKDSNSTLRINVSEYQIEVPGQGKFQCLTRNGTRADENDGRTVLLHVFDNGCFPRFSCLEMEKPSRSVLKFRIGQSKRWPIFPVSSVKQQVCTDRQFRKDFDINGNDHMYDIPYTPLVHYEQHYGLRCQFPEEIGFFHNMLHFKEEDMCEGCLYYNTFYSDRFDVRPLKCGADSANLLRYICLTNFNIGDDAKAVITGLEMFRGPLQNFLCWVFRVEGRKREIIVLKAGDCNKLMLDKVLEGDTQPKARFVIADDVPPACRAPIDPYPLDVTQNPDFVSSVAPPVGEHSGWESKPETNVVDYGTDNTPLIPYPPYNPNHVQSRNQENSGSAITSLPVVYLLTLIFFGLRFQLEL